MDTAWQRTFQERMRRFEMRRPPRTGEVTVSIKVRVISGCFHRECSPHAYEIIDEHLSKVAASGTASEFGFEEHESGPELLAYLAVTTAGITLAASVIGLITAIIKARSEGVRKGDRPSDPLELIVRRTHDGSGFHEEIVLRVGHKDPIDEKALAKRLREALRQLLQGLKR